MADQRPEIRAPLTAEIVEHFGFRIALRGFDTNQVREFLRSVAEVMRTQSARIAELERALRDAEQRAEHPVLDDDTLAAALGEETARVLRSANEAAADIRGRAQEHVERVVQQARDDSERLTAEAASILDVRRAAAEAEAAEILQTARDEAARMTADATLVAAAMTEEAEVAARAAIEQAKTERNEVLSDVRRRRRVANTQIEQLRAGRERLLEAYDVVRSTLEQVTAELDVADGEAKAAAEAVGRRMTAAMDPHQADALASTPVEVLEVIVEPPRAQQAEGADSPPPAPNASSDEPAPSALVTDEARSALVTDEAPSAAVADERPEAEAEPVPAAAASAADELFERIRSERAASVEEAKEILRDDAPQVDFAMDRARSRDETCAGLEQHLTRRLKRALQDEQNVVLDRLRSVRGSMSADAALGAESEHLTAYVVIVEPALADAARAGAAATGHAMDVADELVTSVANDLALELVLPLRRRLDERLHEAAAVGDDTITASERVSSAYREAKAQRVGRLAGDWLAAAWAVGVHAATPPGKPGVWAAPQGCCTDCDDNGLAGPVPAGSAFPTGHLYPPAHPGCRCVIAPIP